MVVEMPRPSFANAASALDAGLWQRSDDLIQVMLVVTQGLAQITTQSDTKDDEAPHVPTAYAHQRSAVQSLRVPDLLSELSTLTTALAERLAAGPSEDAAMCLARLLPFIEVLAQTYAQWVMTNAWTVKSTYKLSYVVARVMLDLAQRGFCKPAEEDSSKDGDEGDTVEGTGMGAGTGDKNVSSEIEEEGQVEGLQGEQEEEQEEKDKGGEDDDDEAVEMENDFEGKMEDGKEREEGDDDEGEEEGDHDDHVGDVDPLDPGAVDEKFWGDEEQPEKEGGDELMDQKTQEAPGEAEMSAKESEGEKEQAPDESEAQQDTQHDDTLQDDRDEQGDEMPDDTNERDDGETEEQPAGQDQSEVNVPEGDRLDLPEDLNLGSEDGDEQDDELGDGMELPEDEREGEDDEGQGGDDIDMASEDEGEAVEDAPAATGVTEEDTMEQEEAPNQNLDLSASNDAQAQESADAGQGQGGRSEDAAEKRKPEEGDVPMDEADKEAEDEAKGEG
jgi:midasin